MNREVSYKKMYVQFAWTNKGDRNNEVTMNLQRSYQQFSYRSFVLSPFLIRCTILRLLFFHQKPDVGKNSKDCPLLPQLT